MAGKQINAILSLTDKFSTPLFKVAGNADKVTKDMQTKVAGLNKVANKAEKKMDAMVRSAAKWGKRMAIAGAGISLKVGWDGLKELDAGARKVKSIAKDALELGEIKDGLLELSGKTGVSVEDLAEAQYMAISSSVAPKDSLAYAELASKMGKAGFADPREAIDLVTSMQNAYGEKGIGSAIKMADQFLHTQNKGKIEIGQMTQYYGKLIPLFSQAAVGYDEMNAAMATLTKMGMKPAEASTALAGAMRIMMKGPTTDKQAEKMKQLGISFSAAELKAKGFGGMMSDVMKVAGGDMDKLSQIFPNARALLAGATMTGKEGMAEYNKILKELRSDTSGALDEAYDVIQGSIGNQWDILKQNLKNINTKFYMNYEGNLAEKLRELNVWFQDNPEIIEEKLTKITDAFVVMGEKVGAAIKFIGKHKETIKGIGIFIGAAYGALKALRKFAAAKKTLDIIFDGLSVAKLGGVGLAIVGFAGAVTALYFAYKKLKEIREKMAPPEQLAGVDQPQLSIDGIGTDAPELTGWENSLVNIAEAMSSLWENMKKIKEGITRLRETLMGVDSSAFDWIFLLPGPLGQVARTLKALSMNAGTIFDGVSEGVEGLLDILNGALELDLPTVLGGIKKLFRGFGTTIEGIWGTMVDLITMPISAVVKFIDNNFGEKAQKVKNAWERLVNFLKKPITATVNLFSRGNIDTGGGGTTRTQGAGSAGARARQRKASGASRVDSGIYSRYTGDHSWKGGIVQVHEKGGEILDLPGGTRIFPHDRSVRMAYEEGANKSGGGSSSAPPINVNIYGDVYGDDDYIDRVGKGITARLVNELANI